MKNIIIHSNNQPVSIASKTQLLNVLKNEPGINIVTEQENPDYIISIGGDGTLLSAFHQYQHLLDQVQFIGIHTGHLGFYTDWLPKDIEQLIDYLKSSDGSSIHYPLLDVEVTLSDGDILSFVALNEMSIRSQNATMVMDIYIKDFFFETFRGDGICLSTPSGSTGLNKSLGGAVIHPRVEAMQLTEMASINNRVYRTLSSPMIIPKDEWVILKFKSEKQSVNLQIDQLYFTNLSIKKIITKISDKKIHFAKFKHTHFWDRVEEAFIGSKNHEK